MLKVKVTKTTAARQLEPKVLSEMKRSLPEQLEGLRGSMSQSVPSTTGRDSVKPAQVASRN